MKSVILFGRFARLGASVATLPVIHLREQIAYKLRVAMRGPLNLVVLHDYSWITEEDELPPEGWSTEVLEEMYPNWEWDAGDGADSDRGNGLIRTASVL